jgi:hypothetical protein
MHSNSWGDQCLGPGNCPSSGRYLEQSEQADSFAFNNRMNLILFAASNDGDQADETDKKVSPPASENIRPFPDNVLFPNGRSFDFSIDTLLSNMGKLTTKYSKR